MGTPLDLRGSARLLAGMAAALLTFATMAGACVLDRTGAGKAGDGGSGTGNPCDFCPGTDTACSFRTCEAGECGTADAFSGTLCSTDGGRVCDGAGNCVECSEVGHCGPQQLCQQNKCVPAACANGSQDGLETDVDCGGGECAGCENGELCSGANDCLSVFCNNAGQCQNCGGDIDDCAVISGYCDNGTCRPKLGLGEGCGSADACLTGFFCPPQDGVCCDEPCDGTCEACQGSKTGGANGTCALVVANDDPDGECGPEPATCGANDTGCSGTAAACNTYPEGSICQSAGCAGGFETQEVTCDGVTTSCDTPPPEPCVPYVCNVDTCHTSCSSQAECAVGYDCDGSDCLLELGQPCGTNGECLSGQCKDTVCCDTSCGGKCNHCLGAYTGQPDGTCGPIVIGDPDDECNGDCPC